MILYFQSYFIISFLFSVVHLNLGYCLDMLKRYKEAEEKYRYVAKLDDKHSRNPHLQLTGIVSALGYLGKIQLEQARYQVGILFHMF